MNHFVEFRPAQPTALDQLISSVRGIEQQEAQ